MNGPTRTVKKRKKLGYTVQYKTYTTATDTIAKLFFFYFFKQ